MANRIYLESLTIPSDNRQIDFIQAEKRTVFSSFYPFKIFFERGRSTFDFAPITIFYGSNGSGKTTLLNVLAEKCRVTRHSAFNSSAFFTDFVDFCRIEGSIPRDSHILTSDDVTDYLLNIRALNDGIDLKREEIFEDFLDRKFHSNRLSSIDDYDDWKESYDAKRLTQSEFTRRRVMKNVEMRSNGETALKYYVDRIGEKALYLIDEPENSLSPAFQQQLCDYLADSARFFGCQLIIATHSPFFLSIPNAMIYDLDSNPIAVKDWTELENVRAYYDLFKKHEHEFD